MDIVPRDIVSIYRRKDAIYILIHMFIWRVFRLGASAILFDDISWFVHTSFGLNLSHIFGSLLPRLFAQYKDAVRDYGEELSL